MKKLFLFTAILTILALSPLGEISIGTLWNMSGHEIWNTFWGL